MSVIVTDKGFGQDTYFELEAQAPLAPNALIGLDRLQAESGEALAEAAPVGVRLANDVEPEDLVESFAALSLIAIDFPSFADGRGFSLALRLRALGFKGRLRALGHVIVDQYAYARACGFDEVAIDAALAKRQPEAQWLRAAELSAMATYRDKLTRRAA